MSVHTEPSGSLLKELCTSDVEEEEEEEDFGETFLPPEEEELATPGVQAFILKAITEQNKAQEERVKSIQEEADRHLEAKMSAFMDQFKGLLVPPGQAQQVPPCGRSSPPVPKAASGLTPPPLPVPPAIQVPTLDPQSKVQAWQSPLGHVPVSPAQSIIGADSFSDSLQPQVGDLDLLHSSPPVQRLLQEGHSYFDWETDDGVRHVQREEHNLIVQVGYLG